MKIAAIILYIMVSEHSLWLTWNTKPGHRYRIEQDVGRHWIELDTITTNRHEFTYHLRRKEGVKAARYRVLDVTYEKK